MLKDYTREILREIASAANDVPNRISLSGHTDATPYAAGERGYSNWELSADRANASRRELIAAGIAENKIIRVVGLGSSAPLDRTDPHNPINRRISITVLNQKAERRILEDDITGGGDAAGHGTPGAAAPADGGSAPAASARADAVPAAVAPGGPGPAVASAGSAATGAR